MTISVSYFTFTLEYLLLYIDMIKSSVVVLEHKVVLPKYLKK